MKLHLLTLLSNEILNSSKLKTYAGDRINMTQKLKFVFWRGKTHFRKTTKCWLSAFCLVSQLFSEAFFLQRRLSRDCVVKGKDPFLLKVREMK